MVCASTEKAEKIAGGFVLVNVPSLMRAWRGCRTNPLKTADFRAWLACHELVARRCRIHETRDRSPSYRVVELARLTGTSEKRARASVRRLVAAGLLEWSDDAIGFPEPVQPVEDLDAIGRGKGTLAIPRRILRFLVAGATAAMIATVLGLLLRCLSRRKGGFDGRGRVKASWIARTFGISIPAVKVARRELIALGWITAEDSDQWTMNRWGRPYMIDLGWSAPATSSEPDSIPPRPDLGSNPIPPDLHQEPLRERIQNQEPAGGPSGFSIEGRGKEDQPPAKPLSTPKLADVHLDDLKSTARLLDLYRQAVARGLVTTSEADRLRFVGAAEHALAIAQNPAALFVWLVLRGCWRYITGADEDSARRRLRVHDFGGPKLSAQPSRFTSFSSSRPIEPGGLSEDARIVREIRAATIRAGIFRDPWPTFHARYPEWTRERWDMALGELGLA
jgi:hypothetical protein